MPIPTAKDLDSLTIEFHMADDGTCVASTDQYPVNGFGRSHQEAVLDLNEAIRIYAEENGVSPEEMPSLGFVALLGFGAAPDSKIDSDVA